MGMINRITKSFKHLEPEYVQALIPQKPGWKSGDNFTVEEYL